MRALMALLVALGLALNSQSWSDATAGNGIVPSWTEPMVRQIFPPCATEDSSWCYWDADARGNRWGESFFTVGNEESATVIIFD